MLRPTHLAMPFSPESAFVACRFVHSLSLMLLFGQSAFIALLAPPNLRPPLQKEGHFLLLGSACLTTLTALLMVPIEAAQMGNGWPDATRHDAWHAVLKTAFGKVWSWHLTLAMGALMLTATTASSPGVVNTALVLQGWPIHLQRPYEAMLDTKIVVVAVMTAIAVYNRYRWVPAFKTNPDAALAALKRNTYIEIALGCVVLLLVALIATDDPR